jgi:ABC-type glutathione transport system ATPase component
MSGEAPTSAEALGNDVLLELRDLAIATPERNLCDGVSLDVRKGRVTALVGHSGSGKTLTARAVMGVLDVDPGLIRGTLRYPGLSDRDWFDGVRGQGVPAQKRLLRETARLRGGYITYSPQSASSALNPGRTIGRQIQMAIARRKEAPEDLGLAIKDVLSEVGLPPRAAAAGWPSARRSPSPSRPTRRS